MNPFEVQLVAFFSRDPLAQLTEAVEAQDVRIRFVFEFFYNDDVFQYSIPIPVRSLFQLPQLVLILCEGDLSAGVVQDMCAFFWAVRMVNRRKYGARVDDPQVTVCMVRNGFGDGADPITFLDSQGHQSQTNLFHLLACFLPAYRLPPPFRLMEEKCAVLPFRDLINENLGQGPIHFHRLTSKHVVPLRQGSCLGCQFELIHHAIAAVDA